MAARFPCVLPLPMCFGTVSSGVARAATSLALPAFVCGRKYVKNNARLFGGSMHAPTHSVWRQHHTIIMYLALPYLCNDRQAASSFLRHIARLSDVMIFTPLTGGKTSSVRHPPSVACKPQRGIFIYGSSVQWFCYSGGGRTLHCPFFRFSGEGEHVEFYSFQAT